MLNSLVDVVASPADMTGRTVTLTRMNEMAARMRTSGDQLHELEYSVNEQLTNNATRINQLAQSIAEANDQIARAKGNGQSPNDLLDRRDQLIRELNQYIQTTQIPADDGSIGVFIGGSQALVLGTRRHRCRWPNRSCSRAATRCACSSTAPAPRRRRCRRRCWAAARWPAC